jgi:DNA gyrase subunit A
MSDTTDLERDDGGNVEPRELSDEMRASYLDYAMSVIVGRALPDVRDGLKPVHRRVLFAMSEAGLAPNRSYVKCATVVGDTMGRYHPHGDSAIYDTLVRLAQDFSSRYPLVDGQGNFGNIDGFSAAAMRYTECRLTPAAMQMLRDLDADTVDFGPNYDGKRQQPLALPARLPNLLVNGSQGIAVGMATNIPPHNVAETIDAVVAMIDDPHISVEGLMEHLPGPDFPTGGIIMGHAGIREAYTTGRGRIRVRARTEVEELANGRTAIVVTELPYMVRKGGDDGVVSRIAELVREGVIPEIADIADLNQKGKAGTAIRLELHLKRDAIPNVVLNKLFKHTALQSTFGANMVALVDNVPRTLGLRELIGHYVAHQKDVVTRRSQFELARAERQAHILEGYLVALDQLDAVIALIRASADADGARHGLMEQFELSEEQAQAILDLRLQRLTSLEQDRIRAEHAELMARIAELRAILGDEARVYALVKEELAAVRAELGDPRRTTIEDVEGEIDVEALIADEEMVISVTRDGYVKRVPLDDYRAQRRGGVGVRGMALKDDDPIEHIFVASAHDYVLFFTSVGKIYRVKVWQAPLAGREGRGRALQNLLPLREGERVMSIFRTRDYAEGRYLVFGTKFGIVKKTELKRYDTNLRADGIIALVIREGDELVDVRLANEGNRVMMVSRNGSAVSFDESDVRPMGRSAAGVRGMALRAGDEVIALRVPRPDDDLIVVTEQGYGKRTPVADYPIKGRGTMGVLTVDRQAIARRGPLAGAVTAGAGDDLMVITAGGIVTRQAVGEIRQTGRATQGVIVQKLRDPDDRIAAIAIVREPDGEADADAALVEPSPAAPDDDPAAA